MRPKLVAELQRMHARWYRMARDAHRIYCQFPGTRTRENELRIIELQKNAWAFAYAARIGMEPAE